MLRFKSNYKLKEKEVRIMRIKYTLPPAIQYDNPNLPEAFFYL